ncbi:MAG: hypothetical protein ACYDCK_02250 [Thermoplasmatota archaeon]
MNKDTLIGIIGAVVLVLAMVGVFVYERNSPAAQAAVGAGDLKLTSAPGPTAQGSSAFQGGSDQTVHIATTNVTNVTFTISWTAASGADTLTATVTPPAGVTAPSGATQSSASGKITISIPVPNPKPTNGPETPGVGDWKIHVDYKSSSATAPPPLPAPAGPDATVTWSVATMIESWQASK